MTNPARNVPAGSALRMRFGRCPGKYAILWTMHLAEKSILVLVWERDISAREFLAGFAHYSNSRSDWHVSLRHATDAIMSNTAQDIAAGMYDGIAMTDTFLAAHPEFGENPATVVTVIGDIKSCPRLPQGRFAVVNIDNMEIGRLAAHHLMSLGKFAHYAFVPPLKSDLKPGAWDRQRADGFRRRLATSKISCEIFDHSVPLPEWLHTLPKPTAIMAACDYTAVDVMTECAKASLRIPQDIAILGVDDDELLCEFTRPSLTSIRPSHFKSGLMAARALNGLFHVKRGASSRSKANICSGARIIERESTHYLSPAQHLVHTAMAYIRANVCKPIDVADVVCHLGVSRRLADLRFRECHGKTIHETIIETKLEELATRLLTSNRAIGNITAALGFNDLSYIGRLFRKRYGVTMSDWRTGHMKPLPQRKGPPVPR